MAFAPMDTMILYGLQYRNYLIINTRMRYISPIMNNVIQLV